MSTNPEAVSNAPVEPYVLRGHHIENVLQLMAMGAGEFTRAAFAGCAQVVDDFDGQSYFVDVYGTTANKQLQVAEGVVGYAQRLWDLAPEYPVIIVENRKDGICNSCAFGKHCEVRSLVPKPEELPESIRVAGDDFNYMYRLYKTAGILGLSDAVRFVHEERIDDDGYSYVFAELTTTAGVVREVITSYPFNNPDADAEDVGGTEKNAEPRQILRGIDPRNPGHRRALLAYGLAHTRVAAGVIILSGIISGLMSLGARVQLGDLADDVPYFSDQALSYTNEVAADRIRNIGEDFTAVVIGGIMLKILPSKHRAKEKLDKARNGEI